MRRGATCVLGLASLFLAGTALAQEQALFERPYRVKADDKVIDTGEAWGHCGPCIADVDGDGLPDLLVGDFSGFFRFYKNVGTKDKPIYTDKGQLQAGGVAAQVPIY